MNGANDWPSFGDTCCGRCEADTCYVDQVVQQIEEAWGDAS